MTEDEHEEKYPEHAKLREVKEQSQACGEFLSWLQNVKGVVLAKRHEHGDECYEPHDCDDPVHECSLMADVHVDGCNREQEKVCPHSDGELVPAVHLHHAEDLLAEFFEIDREKLDEEKRAMLAEVRDGDGGS